ncbi:DUF1064 domain-containing protein [Sphingomonas paeninsulae]|uniref:DUF1064 domain-containing protein n=1 Tax=Sphingomonas paeninsulae TaxID=2319844 RepID=A0A494TKR4_SPHPE|nr:DUF1064 domain-containing protein [Sphingomonas paeninsulae]
MPTRTKYRAVKTVCGALHLHDSKAEARRCDDLTALEAAGHISRLEQQPVFRVEINGKLMCRYVADFAWFTDDCRIVEDCKGFKTDIYRLKKKLVEASHPGVVITEWPVRAPKKRKPRAKATA